MLSEEQQSYLVAELASSAYDGLSGSNAFSLLNVAKAVTVTSQVLTPLQVDELMGLVGDESAAKLVVNPNFCDIRDKVIRQDYVGVGLWAAMLAKGGQILNSERDAILAYVARTSNLDSVSHVPPRIATAFPGKTMPNWVEQEDFDAAWSMAGRL